MISLGPKKIEPSKFRAYHQDKKRDYYKLEEELRGTSNRKAKRINLEKTSKLKGSKLTEITQGADSIYTIMEKIIEKDGGKYYSGGRIIRTRKKR